MTQNILQFTKSPLSNQPFQAYNHSTQVHLHMVWIISTTLDGGTWCRPECNLCNLQDRVACTTTSTKFLPLSLTRFSFYLIHSSYLLLEYLLLGNLCTEAVATVALKCTFSSTIWLCEPSIYCTITYLTSAFNCIWKRLQQQQCSLSTTNLFLYKCTPWCCSIWCLDSTAVWNCQPSNIRSK